MLPVVAQQPDTDDPPAILKELEYDAEYLYNDQGLFKPFLFQIFLQII